MRNMSLRHGAAVAATLLASASVGPTHDPGQDAAEVSLISSAEAEMSVIGIDRQTAEAAGNTVVETDQALTLLDRSGEVIAELPLDGKFAPFDRVYGNCGSSYVYIYDEPGPLSFSMETGFNVNGDGPDFQWVVSVDASGHSGGFGYTWEDAGPQWPSPNWTSGLWTEETSESSSGYTHFAEVTTGVAYLTDGRVCGSMHPTHATTIF